MEKWARNPVADRVIELWNAEKMTATEIGIYLGITKNAVVGIVNRARPKGLITRPIDQDKVRNTKPAEKPAPKTEKIKKVFQKPSTPALAREPSSITWKVTPMPKPIVGKHLIDLNERDCRFPIDRLEGQHIFCGEPARDYTTRYCAHHHKTVWVKREKPTGADRQRLARIKKEQRARKAPVFGRAMEY